MAWRWKSTNYNEACPDSPDESFARDGNDRATKKLLVDWDTRDQAVRDFIGWSSVRSLPAVANLTVTAASVANPIVITTSAAHGLSTGRRVRISDVTGNTAANGDWTITVLSATTFSLNVSFGNAAYVSGGTVQVLRKYIHRDIPLPHGKYPDFLWAESARPTGTAPRSPETIVSALPDAPGGIGEAMHADSWISVGFFAPLFTVLDDAKLIEALVAQSLSTWPDESFLRRYISGHHETNATLQKLPNFASLIWNVDPPPRPAVDNTLAINITSGTYYVTWHEVPLTAYPITAIISTANKCNGKPFGISGSPFGIVPAGKLVCCVPKCSKPYRMANGELACDITYPFLFHPHNTLLKTGMAGGANCFYRWNHTPPGFVNGSRNGNTNMLADGTLVQNDGVSACAAADGYGPDTQLLFPPADFSGLFQPEP